MITNESDKAVNYDYTKDKPIADKTELEVANLIEKSTGYKLEAQRKDNKYDLKFSKVDKDNNKWVFRVEVKEDFTCERTGNIGLEFECRNKPSGIAVSQAEYYCYKIHESKEVIGIYLIKTKVLKSLIADKRYHRIVVGGDLDSNSKNYLFKLDIIKANTERKLL